METRTLDLAGELTKFIKSESFLVPQFQREFVWNDAQVRLLVDSIARDYPIGSLLVLPKTDEGLQLAAGNLSIQSQLESTERLSVGEKFYVLDGQQRLTSLARVFLNSHPNKVYYIDLWKLYEEFDKEKSNWVVSRRRSDNKERLKNGRYLRSDAVLSQQKSDLFVSEYFEDYSDLKIDKSQSRSASGKVKGIFETIRNYKVPVVVLDRDSNIESVCRVFETINSTGTRLTTFDLAVARFYPNPDLKELHRASTAKNPSLGEGEFNLDGERFLQVLALWNAESKETFLEPTRTNLLSLDEVFVQTNWNDAADSLGKALYWAHKQGIRAKYLPNEGLLVALAAFLGRSQQYVEDPAHNFWPLVKKWFFCNAMQQGARQATNYEIGEDYRKFIQLKRGEQVLRMPEVNLTAEDVVNNIFRNDNRFKSIMCLMIETSSVDLLTGEHLGSNVEIHHIFPRSLAKSFADKHEAEKLLDGIANRIPVSSSTNRKLSDRHPSDYFRDLAVKARSSGTVEQTNERLTKCLIPFNIESDDYISQLSTETISAFLKKRAELILDNVRRTVGDKLTAKSMVDIELEDGFDD